MSVLEAEKLSAQEHKSTVNEENGDVEKKEDDMQHTSMKEKSSKQDQNLTQNGDESILKSQRNWSDKCTYLNVIRNEICTIFAWATTIIHSEWR